jgi:hypothetical protein
MSLILPFAFEAILKSYSMYILAFGATMCAVSIVLGVRDHIRNKKFPKKDAEQLLKEFIDDQKREKRRERLRRMAAGLPD